MAPSKNVVIVTGAGRSLGRAIAERCHRDGFAVAVTDIDGEAARVVAQSLDPDARTARAYALDVGRASEVERAFASIGNDLGAPLALVNNAGIYPDHPLLEMAEEAWDAVLRTNLTGTFLCTKAFALHRIGIGGGGSIVNIASTAAFSARIGAAHYSASKAGVVMLTKSASQELGTHGIRVNAVAPGFIEVREDQVSQDYKRQFLTMIPRGRTGRAEDIANTVAFLISDWADFITGECIVVDGGFLAGRPLMRSMST